MVLRPALLQLEMVVVMGRSPKATKHCQATCPLRLYFYLLVSLQDACFFYSVGLSTISKTLIFLECLFGTQLMEASFSEFVIFPFKQSLSLQTYESLKLIIISPSKMASSALWKTLTLAFR